MLAQVEMQHGFMVGSLDIVGMFPNIQVKKALEVVREELENDQDLSSRTDWGVDDIMKLLEISIETYFKTLDGNIYFQRDGLLIGKSIFKLIAGINSTGLKGHMCLVKMAILKIKLYFGRDKWTTSFLFGMGRKRSWSYLCGI